MRQFSKIQLDLLHQLSDGKCHSGKLLGERLGVSRTAIWKHISQLTELGLAIHRIPQYGYQLAQPMIPLDEQLIRHYLANTPLSKQSNFYMFSSLNSTNQFLKELAPAISLDICCTEKQTHGRGRFGRQWYSPFGENIYFSSRWAFDCCLSRLSSLSLVVGLAILASLKSLQIHQVICIKWPNDLLYNHKKLCGILIEVIAETNSYAQVIIGIGMNVNITTQGHSPIDKPWCSLYEITNNYFDRNKLIAHMTYHLDQYIKKFLEQGFTAFISEWKAVDYLQGQFITITQPTGTTSGYASGVNELGQLCLRDEHNKLHCLSSGDTSLSTMLAPTTPQAPLA